MYDNLQYQSIVRFERIVSGQLFSPLTAPLPLRRIFSSPALPLPLRSHALQLRVATDLVNPRTTISSAGES